MASDVRKGLTSQRKRLSCRYLYDRLGSRLFEAICELPEYYVARSEREILNARAADVASMFDQQPSIVEFGSGTSEKTRVLLDAWCRRWPSLRIRYMPIDISRDTLEQSSIALLRSYPMLEIVSVADEYEDGLKHIEKVGPAPRLLLWLGSSIGNLERSEAAEFLRRVGAAMGVSDRLLVGIDLRKAGHLLEAAYDDAHGVTAAFNRNLLAHINQELGADFDLRSFGHRATYDEDAGRIEMHLVSTRTQTVRIEALTTEVTFDVDESIHTENSYKYSRTEIDELASAAGMQVERSLLDSGRQFSVNLFSVVSETR
jgi:L-histidine N-alpha-methyltransferase